MPVVRPVIAFIDYRFLFFANYAVLAPFKSMRHCYCVSLSCEAFASKFRSCIISSVTSAASFPLWL